MEVLKHRNPEGHYAASAEPRSPRPSNIKFRVGQVIRHKKWNYRGVIIGWDEKLNVRNMSYNSYVFRVYCVVPKKNQYLPHTQGLELFTYSRYFFQAPDYWRASNHPADKPVSTRYCINTITTILNILQTLKFRQFVVKLVFRC